MSRPKGEGHRRATRRQRDAKEQPPPVPPDQVAQELTGAPSSGVPSWERPFPADPTTEEAHRIINLAGPLGPEGRWVPKDARPEVAATAREMAGWLVSDDGQGHGHLPFGVVEAGGGRFIGGEPYAVMTDDGRGHQPLVVTDDGGGGAHEAGPGPGPWHHAVSDTGGIPSVAVADLYRGAIDARRQGDERIVTEGGPGVDITKPIGALDVHLDLLRFVSSEVARDQRRGWWAAYYARERPSSPAWERLIEEAASQFRLEEIAMLNRALTFYVTPEMAELALALADGEDAEPLRSTDPWCPSGFVVLPRPGLEYWSPEGAGGQGGPIRVRYIAWEWSDIGRYVDDDPDHTQASQGVRLWAYTDWFECVRGWGLGEHNRASLIAQHGKVVLLDMMGWAVDAEWEATDDDRGSVSSEGVVGAAEHVARLRRYVKALWRLLDEQVVQAVIERDGPTSRRARRAGRIPNDGDVVRVLRLRRIGVHPSGRPMSTEEMAAKFSYRWRVRAHWRHLERGEATLDGDQLQLSTEHRWTAEVLLRLTDANGRRERVKIASVDPDTCVATLAWSPRLVAGAVRVERLAHVREHTSGAADGWLVERFDVVSVER